MKILFFTSNYPTEKRPEQGAFLKDQVISLQRLGMQVDVLDYAGYESQLNYIKAISLLRKKLKSEQYDIIHCHHSYSVYIYIMATMFVSNPPPLVFTFHEGEIVSQQVFGFKKINQRLNPFHYLSYIKSIKIFAIRKADCFITVNRHIISNSFRNEINTLPCGVDFSLFQIRDKVEARKELGLPLDKKIIFFPANPARGDKKFILLEESVKILHDPDIHVVSGGFIPHQLMPVHCAASDVVVTCSAYEASPMVIKEAMAMNIPAVSTDVGDTKEVIGSEPGYYLAADEPGDFAKKLKAALIFEAPTKGRDRLLHLQLDAVSVGKRLIKIYETLLEKKKQVSL